jgi:hypothetical protein
MAHGFWMRSMWEQLRWARLVTAGNHWYASLDAAAGGIPVCSHQLRPVAGDSVEAEAVKVLTRAHKTLIWERTRHLLRLRLSLSPANDRAIGLSRDSPVTDAEPRSRHDISVGIVLPAPAAVTNITTLFHGPV